MSYIKHSRIVLSVCTLFLLTTIIWGVNKGFDISDEGYFMLGYTKLQEIGITETHFHIIVRNIFGWLDINLINIRILRLFVKYISVLFFYLGLRKWLKVKYNREPDQLTTFCFIFIGALVGYMSGRQALSYNILNLFFVAAVIGCLLSIFADLEHKNSPFKTTYLFSFIIGFLLVFQFFTKFTSALFQLFFVLLLYFIYPLDFIAIKNNILKRFELLLFLVAGIIFGSFLFTKYFISIPKAINDIWLSIHLLQNNPASGYQTYTILSRFYEASLQIFGVCVWSAGCYFILKLTVKYLDQTRLPKYLKIIILFTAILAITLYSFSKYNYNYGSTILIGLVFFIITFSLDTLKNSDFKPPLIIVLAILFIEPFIGSIGSNSELLIQVTYYVFIWLGIVVVLTVLINKNLYVPYYVMAIIGVISTALIIQTFIVFPFKQKSLFLQNQDISYLPNTKGLKVDLETKQYLTDINNVIKDYPGYSLIGLYKMPGIIYLLGRNSPGSVSWDRVGSEIYCKSLVNTNMDLSKTIVIVKDTVPQKMIDCLKTRGVDYMSYKAVVLNNLSVSKYQPRTTIYIPK
jgi:hypothetical protein